MSHFPFYYRLMQQSWVYKLIDCIRNREKQAKKKARNSGEQESPTKHQRVTPNDVLLRRYPARVVDAPVDDACSIEQYKKAIEEESKKSKPRDSVLQPLMKSTFQARRMFIQAEDTSVEGTLQSFPALSCPAVVSYYIQFVRYPILLWLRVIPPEWFYS